MPRTAALGSVDQETRIALLSLQARLDAVLALAAPPGYIVATIAVAAPAGYLILDGSTVTGGSLLYPKLWRVVPAAWKSGANLVLPDARGRTIIGAGTGAGLTARTLNATVGNEAVQLSDLESGLPVHTHVENLPNGTGGGVAANPGLVISANYTNQAAATTPTAFATAVSVAAAAAQAHNNMQPSIIFNWIVKT